MQRIKVGIADDHTLFREGMSVILDSTSDMELSFSVENGRKAIDLFEKDAESAEVVLVDLKMPVMDGFETTRHMKAQFPNVKILILTMIDEDDYILHALDEGANGYLLKDSTAEEVTNAIRQVAKSDYYFSDRASRAMVEGRQKRSKGRKLLATTPITEREREVLELICQEMTTSDIADKLFLSHRTVESHRKNLMEKLGAKNTAGLVVRAVKEGYV